MKETFCFLLIVSLFIPAFSETPTFATKGVTEIAGSISTSVTAEDDSTRYVFSLAPAVNYYLKERWHVGIKPIYNYNLIYTKGVDDYDTDYEILPILMAGYTVPVNDSLYFDVSPQFGYRYSNIFSSNNETQYRYLYYGLVCALKIEYGTALINVELDQYYKDRLSDSGSESIYRIALGVGFSVYF